MAAAENGNVEEVRRLLDKALGADIIADINVRGIVEIYSLSIFLGLD